VPAHRARAMGCELAAEDGDFDRVLRLFRDRERIFSRFEPESELNRVNAAAGSVVHVSEQFARALETALAAAAATGGVVDPTVGAAVVASGYDRDFDALVADRRPAGGAPAGRWRELRLHGRLLWRPPGLVLDLNGVVKAQAVDDALRESGASVVSAGGDLAAREPTTVALPSGDVITLVRGGLATSSRLRRRWLRAGAWQHHLIDSRTGRPSASRWDEVTVAAGGCLEADVAAKAAFLLSGEGPEWLDARGLAGAFLEAGRVVLNRTWRRAVSNGLLRSVTAVT
jgi:FAD:protein FMN transferase